MAAPPSTAAERRDHAKAAGAEAAQILTAAERSILAAMASVVTRVTAGHLTTQMAAREVRTLTAVTLGAASAKLRAVYGRATKQATGEDGPLPDAPSQVAAAILHAQHDAGVAFGAVLAAMVRRARGCRPRPARTAGSRTGPRCGERRRVAARLALAAIAARGLTGYVIPEGRRSPLAAYAERAVRTATARLARPVNVADHGEARSAAGQARHCGHGGVERGSEGPGRPRRRGGVPP